jgi:hypothetical protein
MRPLLLLAIALALAGCTSQDVQCTLTASDAEAIARVLREDWSTLDTVQAIAKWPHPLVATAATSTVCDGTITLVHQSGREGCRDTLLFDDVRGNGSACRRSLSALTIVRQVPSNITLEHVLAIIEPLVKLGSPPTVSTHSLTQVLSVPSGHYYILSVDIDPSNRTRIARLSVYRDKSTN